MKNRRLLIATVLSAVVSSCLFFFVFDSGKIRKLGGVKNGSESVLADHFCYSVVRVWKDHNLVAIDAGSNSGLTENVVCTIPSVRKNCEGKLVALEPIVSVWSFPGETFEEIEIGDQIVFTSSVKNLPVSAR